MKINLVSIVIPAYNEEQNIACTLESIKLQDYSGKIELIVVDNNSTDKTSQIAYSYGAKVILEKNKGTRFAYQRGMSEAKGEVILVTNADSIVPKNWVSSIIAVYQQDPEIVGVGTKVGFYDVSPLVTIIFNILYFLNPTKSFWGQSMSCTKEVFEKVGGINHGFDTNEDGIFGLLVKREGKVNFLNHIVVRSSGRRYSGGLLNILKNWLNGIGGNAFIIQLRFLLTGKIEGNMKSFEDVRKEQ